MKDHRLIVGTRVYATTAAAFAQIIVRCGALSTEAVWALIDRDFVPTEAERVHVLPWDGGVH
jgi:hypothetical protein